MTHYNIHTLPNGLRVIHLPSDSPVIYCGIGIKVGSRHEQQGEEGLAHFCEHVTFKGTRRRSALQILNSLESVGGDLNAFTNKEDTIFYAAILKEHLPRAVDLLTDIVFNSTYPDQEIAHEVDVICDEIESYNDSPAELIYDEFENKLFQGHPLGHHILGTRERVKSFTSEDARRFTQRYYRPDNAIFFAYGNLNFLQLVRKLESAGVRRYEDAREREMPKYNPSPSSLSLPSPSHHQSHVMLGCKTYAFNDPRRMPLYLLNNILGGPGMNARLNLSLRERHGLVYTIESSMASYSDTGCWSVYFGCDHHDVKRCLRLVNRELDRMMQHPLSERQLLAAKRQLKGQIAIACDNREQFALDFAKSFLHYDKERDIDYLFQQIDAITALQLQGVAQECFDPQRLTTLMIQ
ncbi:MAG: insulinase family protein [Prevotella sp.]|nr:insulinase family protein [Prevotella sp.]